MAVNVALVFSGIDIFATVLLAIRTNSLSKKQIKLEQVNTELQIRETIVDAEERVRSYGLKAGEEPTNQAAEKAFNSAMESYRNAYEEACSKYVSGEIDKEWFRKNYQLEIQQLVDNDLHKGFYSDMTHSAYQNTIAVYREWLRFVQIHK